MRASEARLRTPSAAREEEDGSIKQKNEGRWRFTLRDEDDGPPSSSSSQQHGYRGCVLLEVALPRHLDSSLIDVDVHPTWVSVVVKAKLLRLKVRVRCDRRGRACLLSWEAETGFDECMLVRGERRKGRRHAASMRKDQTDPCGHCR